MKRQRSVSESIENDRAEKEKEKERRHATRKQNAAVRSGGGDEEGKIDEEALKVPQKKLETYEQIFKSKTEFFTTCNPDMIEEALIEHLRNKEKVEPKVNKSKYKIKFSLATKGQDDVLQNTGIVMNILKVSDSKYCVEFQKTEGNNVLFHEHFTDLMG